MAWVQFVTHRHYVIGKVLSNTVEQLLQAISGVLVGSTPTSTILKSIRFMQDIAIEHRQKTIKHRKIKGGR
jgi:hypothetical protein